VVKYYHPMPRISGILRFTYDLIGLLSQDFQIRLITYRYSPEVAAREEHRAYEIIRTGAPFPIRAGRIAKGWRPDVVIFGSGFWRPHYLFPYWELLRAGLTGFRGPVILTQYSNMTSKFFSLCGLLRPRPDAVIVTTEALRTDWRHLYPEQIYYIPPGVQLQAGGGKSTAVVPKRRPLRIGYFGHLQAHKGPDILLRIFQQVKPETAELLIHGEGEMLAGLKEQARGDDSIIFQGYVPDIGPWIRSCDLVVLPYRSATSVLGYSRAALESLAAGVPLLTTFNPAVAPLIEEGGNGFIAKNEAELKEKITVLIENRSLREKMREGALETARAYDIKGVAEQYINLILEMIERAYQNRSNR